MLIFFFFKQKTAYEMRISDWSSDVCSSDLLQDMGAEYVLDSSKEDFVARLQDAVAATGTTIAFDAIGGGHLVSQILNAIEQVVSKNAPYSRYGSDILKQA